MSFGTTTTTPNVNKLRSTFIYGALGNVDKTDGSVPAIAIFQRNVTVGGNLILGTETIDSSGNAVDSASNIQFTLNKVLYSIPLRTLSYLMNVTSDIQQQLSTISSSGSSSIQHPSSLTVGGQYQNNSGDFSAFTNTFFVAPTASFNSGLNANSVSSFYDISFNRFLNGISKTVFGYLSNVTSDIQQQINTVSSSISNIGNNPLILYSTLNVSGLATLTQLQINTSLSVLQNISFIGTLNNITANTFSFLSGLTSNIQNQINSINTVSPVGSVISYAGSSASLTGFLPCDGNQYPISSYIALFNVIQYTYGGDPSTGYFRVPNYKGIFLRGAGTQAVNLNVIAGAGGAVQKTYNSPSLGTIYTDETAQSTTSNYVNGITQEVKSFITGGNAFGPPTYNFNYANAVSSLQYTTGHDTINNGYTETFPVHTSINYFIKY
jgi:microcystin-dependent protein